ncbi:hypothetical protein C8Q74DRAFT_687586 [Fomes fomentarius]|nr:hypothetical protein C8Q74DRAFT_687586 [Fomes fomentarius]
MILHCCNMYRSHKDRSIHVGLLADFFWRNIFSPRCVPSCASYAHLIHVRNSRVAGGNASDPRSCSGVSVGSQAPAKTKAVTALKGVVSFQLVNTLMFINFAKFINVAVYRYLALAEI